MAFGSVSLEKRIKNNVKNYSLGQLLDLPIVQKELEVLHSLTGGEFLFTRRHGEIVVMVGEWGQEAVDVIADPGMKFQVSGRTIGHFYYKNNGNEHVDEMVTALFDNWRLWAEQTYLYKETDQFVYEVQFRAEEELNRKAEGVRTAAAVHRVVARAAHNNIIVRAAHDMVIARIAKELIFAAVRPNRIIARAAVNSYAITDVFKTLAGQVNNIITGTGADFIDSGNARLGFKFIRKCRENVIHKQGITIGIIGQNQYVGIS